MGYFCGIFTAQNVLWFERGKVASHYLFTLILPHSNEYIILGITCSFFFLNPYMDLVRYDNVVIFLLILEKASSALKAKQRYNLCCNPLIFYFFVSLLEELELINQ